MPRPTTKPNTGRRYLEPENLPNIPRESEVRAARPKVGIDVTAPFGDSFQLLKELHQQPK